MNLLSTVTYLNHVLAIPTTFILFITALYLTLKFRFLQIRALPRFFNLIKFGVRNKIDNKMQTISPLHALVTAMSTSIGIGTIIGPSVAIVLGGPGALFWLIMYAMCASAIKFAEVAFALQFRKKTEEGFILGGPTAYLNQIHHYLGTWYAAATVILFAGWSSLQANVLANVLEQVGVPTAVSGVGLMLLVFVMLRGGAQKISEFNTKLVPLMSLVYITAGVYILYLQRTMLLPAIVLMIKSAFCPTAVMSGFTGASIMAALSAGIYKGAYITEAGMGTAAIAHSLADAQKPTDQAILAMVSMAADTFFCLLSGIILLTTNVWQTTTVSNVLMYKVFQQVMPVFGKPILVFAILLFATGTIIGNSFNGRQSFALLTRYKLLDLYNFCICCVIFLGAIAEVPLVWQIVDLLLPFVAIPNVLSVLYLVKKNPHILHITR